MRAHIWFMCFTAIAAAPAGCAVDEAGGEGGSGEDQLVLETGEFEVGAGDVFECFYTSVVTDHEMATTGAFGKQVGSGGHHITIYYTTSPRPTGHHPCDDAEMVTWQQVGGTGSEAAEALTLHDGLAIKIPTGAQIVMQTHYINTGESYRVSETAGLQLVDPADVVEYVHQFAVFNGDFLVPAHQTMEEARSCTVPRDLKLVKLLGHMHEWGKHFQLDEVDEAGQVVRSLVDDDVTPAYASHPPIASFGMNEPLVLRAGTRLRQTCSWDNFEDFDLEFPREMCVAYGLFYGGDSDVFCDVE